MTAQIQVTLDDKDVMAHLAKVAARGKSLAPVMAAFGDYLILVTRGRFEREQDPENKPWKPLSDFTLLYKKNDQILTESTDLRNSFHRVADATSVRMGTDRPYAAAHQFGLKKALNIRSHQRKTKAGTTTVKAHTRAVNFPARPFLGFTDQDRVELIETIKDHLLGT